MTALVALPVIVPLVGASLGVLTSPWRWAQRVISLLALGANVVVSVILLAEVDGDEMLVMQAGGWKVPLGITLAVDRLSAVMLVVSSLMLLSVMVYAVGQGAEESRYASFNPVYLVLAAGVSASFVTGDLFNLFVAFEMMLV
ncbi:MAG: Na+/H+ antiporter subunit D, partial [Acidobacteriota bacterium]